MAKPVRPTKAELLALIEAQAPNAADDRKSELVEVAFVLTANNPSAAACVAQAFGIVPDPVGARKFLP